MMQLGWNKMVGGYDELRIHREDSGLYSISYFREGKMLTKYIGGPASTAVVLTASIFEREAQYGPEASTGL